MSNQDAPPVLQELISRTGLEMGNLIADTAQQAAQRIDATIRAAFAHGVAEGLEVGAQVCQAAAPVLAAQHGAIYGHVAEFLRDQLRVSALSVEIPS